MTEISEKELEDLKTVFEKRRDELEGTIMNSKYQATEIMALHKLTELKELYRRVFGEELKP